jgi:uncharacterized SAM-binding protein YcdF (DUF218 family)
MLTTLPKRKPGWSMPTAAVVASTIILPVIATFIVSGKSSMEKLLTNMTQPLFLSIATALIVGLVLIRRAERLCGLLLMLGATTLWILSSSLVTSHLMQVWESSVETTKPSVDEPFDFVIVFGGGTSVSPTGRSQFGNAGDRVGYAAQLYFQGAAKHLVTTGDTMIASGTLSGTFDQKDDPSFQTKQIWMQLGIPDEAISEIPGENTFSEIASLKQRPELWQGKRCGLITSAFHMHRTMRLAKQAGVVALPIAADYRAGVGPITINHFFPETEGLARLQLLIKEWLAMRMGR